MALLNWVYKVLNDTVLPKVDAAAILPMDSFD